jgi:hypothetical protein
MWLETTPREKLADLAKLPNHSDKKYIAHVQVHEDAGRIKPHDTNGDHISFWMYEDFDVQAAVKKVEAL